MASQACPRLLALTLLIANHAHIYPRSGDLGPVLAILWQYLCPATLVLCRQCLVPAPGLSFRVSRMRRWRLWLSLAFLRQRFWPKPGPALRPGYQRLVLSGTSPPSLASGSLGPGLVRCSRPTVLPLIFLRRLLHIRLARHWLS